MTRTHFIAATASLIAVAAVSWWAVNAAISAALEESVPQITGDFHPAEPPVSRLGGE